MTVLKPLDILVGCILIIIIATTYTIKYNSQHLLHEKKILERQIKSEQIAIKTLQTQWAYYTSPAYISKAQEQNNDKLNLVPVPLKNVITIDNLPKKASPILENASQNI